MSKFGIEINVPMKFSEDDALYVLHKTFHRLKNTKDLASEVIIRPFGLGHSFAVDLEVFAIHRRISMDCTIDFVNSEPCDYHYCGNIINEVSEELFCRLQDRIKTVQKSANSTYGLSADAREYWRTDVEVVKQVFNDRFGVPATPKKVIFNNPATIVIWSDGTKTVVKRQKGDRYNKEAGLALCYVKKFCGNNTSRGLNDILKLANDKEEK